MTDRSFPDMRVQMVRPGYVGIQIDDTTEYVMPLSDAADLVGMIQGVMPAETPHAANAPTFGGHTAAEVAGLCDILARSADGMTNSYSETASIARRARDAIRFLLGMPKIRAVSDARTPERIALDLLARLKRAEENGKALRDVVASIAEQEGSAETIRAACRLLVRAYDERMSDAR